MLRPTRWFYPPNSELSDFEKDSLDTFEGKVHVEWESGASVTAMGQLAFFIQLLKTGYRFEPWVKDCPLIYKKQ